jgi:signal peptidase I
LIVPGLGQLYNVQYARAVWAAGIMAGLDVVAAVAFVSVPPARFALVVFLVLIAMSELIARLVFAVDAVFGARRNRLVSPGRYNRIPVYLAFFFGVGLLQVAPGILAMFTIGLRMEIYSMASPSGYPNVLRGDYVVVWKDYYRDHAPRRGELAVFEAQAIYADQYEPSAGFYRIIGLPGDEVRYDDGLLTINNQPATLTPDGAIDYPLGQGKVKRAPVFVETLPDGTRYRIAQNPEELWFWRNRASFTVPPGHLLFFGDNRTAAYDSRFERFVTREGAAPSAYVPIESLRGRVMFVLFSRSLDRIGRPLDRQSYGIQ